MDAIHAISGMHVCGAAAADPQNPVNVCTLQERVLPVPAAVQACWLGGKLEVVWLKALAAWTGAVVQYREFWCQFV
jgi:hypothetical protein